MADTTAEKTTERKRRSKLADFFYRLVKEKPLGLVGGIITLLLLLTGIFASFIAPYGYNVLHPDSALLGPSAHFLLGTDNLGRDLLSRVIYGARISVIVGLSASVIAMVVETTIGVLSGYIGGVFDLVVQRFVDAVMCFPNLILMMVIISIVGPSMLTVILVLGITWGIGGSRLIRGATLSIKENMYVQSAVSLGAPTGSIIFRHILPNIMAPIIIQFTTRVPAIILTEASLSFLGYGIPPPAPSWGSMLSGSGRTYMFLNPWIVVWPGLALSIVVYGVNMFGDAVRDLLDPRLRGGIGRYGLNVSRKIKVKTEAVAPKDL
jgi:peptide/nickel transport system permease protein